MIIGIALLLLALAVNAYGFSTVDSTERLALFSQFLGSSSLILMAFSQFIATRISGVETLFGRLDKGYWLHKWIGISALLCFVLHDIIDAEMNGIPQGGLYDFAETLGEVSYNALIFLVIISIITFVPYHLWKWTHRFIGAMFVLSFLHYLLIGKPFANNDWLGLYISCFCILGMLSYVYTLLPIKWRRWKRFHITNVEQQHGTTVINLSPDDKALTFRAGQFAFISIDKPTLSEPHPFTISSAPSTNGTLRFSIKSLGDFTTGLTGKLNVGDSISVQGGFGRFVRKPPTRNKNKQTEIWIAAGVGITPFAAWAQDLAEDETTDIHLFYAVRQQDQAVHLAELQQRAKQITNFHLHIVESSTGNRLSKQYIAEHLNHDASKDVSKTKVYFCGPTSLRQTLKTQFTQAGLPARHFHYEEFEIRAGIGLRKLLAFALDKTGLGKAS